MTKVLIQTYTIVHEYRARITMVALVGSVVAILFYAVNLYSVISHTVAIRQVEDQVTELSSAVNALDARYLELGSAATPDVLAKYGLTAGKVSVFIPRTASTASIGIVATRGHEL